MWAQRIASQRHFQYQDALNMLAGMFGKYLVGRFIIPRLYDETYRDFSENELPACLQDKLF